ncbi:hypothetical protein [Enterococcus mundtii]|uniref:hypothetical protein n=1 Tax=Enterococcus mundtii TaxID=53346 RepID=UPI0010BE8CAC|nr:hypothetical protein [Enterococcus mundtii]QCJ56134.1 hypothetical protein DDJ96_05725 [Enterococcus mundtii]GKS56370.1 hypothetical protein EMLAB_29850 [Enterococcus mundtii]
MNLKEQMMNEYQKKDIEKLKEAIAATMRMGKNEMHYRADQINDEIRKEFQEGGFTVEDYEDDHSKADGLQLVKFSW